VTIIDHRHSARRVRLDHLSDEMKIVAGIGLALLVAFAVFAVLFLVTAAI
jgi:hypothetical protein